MALQTFLCWLFTGSIQCKTAYLTTHGRRWSWWHIYTQNTHNLSEKKCRACDLHIPTFMAKHGPETYFLIAKKIFALSRRICFGLKRPNPVRKRNCDTYTMHNLIKTTYQFWLNCERTRAKTKNRSYHSLRLPGPIPQYFSDSQKQLFSPRGISLKILKFWSEIQDRGTLSWDLGSRMWDVAKISWVNFETLTPEP